MLVRRDFLSQDSNFSIRNYKILISSVIRSLNQQASSSLDMSATMANNLASITVTPIQPVSLIDSTKIKILAAEMELLDAFLVRKHGVRVLNLNSVHFKTLHQPSLEMDQIKRSLDAALAEPPQDLNKDEGDVDLDATLIVVKEKPNWANEHTLLVDPGEAHINSDERTDFVVDGNATGVLVNESSGLDVATPDVGLVGPSNGELTMTSALPSVQNCNATQKVKTREKPTEKGRGTSNVKPDRKRKTSKPHLTVSKSRVKQSEANARRNRSTAISMNEGDKKYKCGFCEKAFSGTSDKKKHERIHTGEKPFKCNFCPKSFAQLSNKNTHENCHTENKPYTCEFCSSTFSQLVAKNVHMRTHTREKPFQCEQCGATFARKHHEVQHMRVHTGDKPYHCQYCDKPFSRSSLSAHLRIYTNERPYVCLVCAKAFNHSSNLRVHEKTHRK